MTELVLHEARSLGFYQNHRYSDDLKNAVKQLKEEYGDSEDRDGTTNFAAQSLLTPWERYGRLSMTQTVSDKARTAVRNGYLDMLIAGEEVGIGIATLRIGDKDYRGSVNDFPEPGNISDARSTSFDFWLRSDAYLNEKPAIMKTIVGRILKKSIEYAPNAQIIHTKTENRYTLKSEVYSEIGMNIADRIWLTNSVNWSGRIIDMQEALA